MLKPADPKRGGGALAAGLLMTAATLLLAPPPCRTEEAAAAKKKAASPTSNISGRALDADGRPVGAATVWLTREDNSDFDVPVPTVIAQAQSRADGRFELTPLDSELKKPVDDPPAEFRIWIRKPGLAVAHSTFFGEPDQQTYCMWMKNESPVAIRLQKPDGSPCGGATVKTILVSLGPGNWAPIPQPLQDALQVRTAPDGRVEVPGFDGQFGIVTIATAEFGIQTLSLPEPETSPVAVKLRETRVLEGRLVLPKGEQADLSKLRLVLNQSSGEKSSDPTDSRKSKPAETAPEPGTWYDHFELRPDRDGRFTVAKLPKGQHGRIEFNLTGADDIAFANGRNSFVPPLDALRTQDPLKFDIPLEKGVWVTRVVRDARTGRPLPGAGVVMLSSQAFIITRTTDANGRIRVPLCPGDTYHVHCYVPDGYLCPRAGSEDDVVIPSGVNQCELKPIELVPGCTIKGDVCDASGRPLAGIRVRGTWHADNAEPAKGPAADVCRLATTDRAGHFRFDRVEAGAKVTLMAVRSGVLLADPIQIAADDKPVRLQEKSRELVALGGRILGADRKPIPGAQVVVEVADSPDPPSAFRMTVDLDGSFRTPPHFPAQLKYRLTVGSMLQDVASSNWMCPAVSGSQFPDLVVDRARVAGKLSGKEIVARVNGRPILASEILERAYPESLLPGGQSLLIASKELASGGVTEQEFRGLQETAIKSYVGDYVRTRVLAQALEAQLEKEEKENIEKALDRMFDGYLERLKKDMHVATREDVDRKLGEQGSSLASLKVEFRYRLLADEYRRRAGDQDSDVDWHQLLAYYQAHRDSYATREKVGWQLLEIEFDKPRTESVKEPIEPQMRAIIDPGAHAAESDKQGSDPDRRDAESGKPGTDFDKLRLKLNDLGSESDKRKTVSHWAFDPSHHDSSEVAGHRSREQARRVMVEAQALLRKGEPFDAVVKKLSDGPNADRGGWQSPTSADSVAHVQTAAALRRLAEGETSPVIETDHSFQIVRVVSRIPAGRKTFDEVEASIRQDLQRELIKQSLAELYSRASIESPFKIDIASLIQASLPDCR